MIVYLVHPNHGTHIAYSVDEVERLTKLYGWSVREDKKPAEKKKRGRPRKVEK